MATRAQIREVDRYIRKWQPLLQLQPWDIRVEHRSEPFTDDPEVKAATEPRYRYWRATIEIFPIFWTLAPADREEYFSHELYHLQVAELADLVNQELVTKKHLEDVVEKTTELLARGAATMEKYFRGFR